MKKSLITFSLLFMSFVTCIGQSSSIKEECNNDELYGILYGDDREQYIQNHQHVATDTLGMDSIKLVYYPNGAICYENWFFRGKCIMKRYYYSNGQIFKEQFDKKRGVTSETESFPVNYGKWCYLYGFKVYRRTDVAYNCDGTPWYICFLGVYNHKKVSIKIDFVNINNQNILTGAWISKKNGTLIQQFDWDEATQTWTAPAVNHVIKRKNIIKRRRCEDIIII